MTIFGTSSMNPIFKDAEVEIGNNSNSESVIRVTFPATIYNVDRLYGTIVNKNPAVVPKQVIFNNPATIIFWSDGDKTVVKKEGNTEFNPYYGFCTAVTKKVFGHNSIINRIVKNATYQEKKND